MAAPHIIYAEREDLCPSPLPSLIQIQSIAYNLPESTIQESVVGAPYRMTVHYNEHYVVKFGSEIYQTEGLTMKYLYDNTSIPVPRVYAIVRSPDLNSIYIIMERIIGNSLRKEWRHLTPPAKDFVIAQFKEIYEQMRQLPSPNGYCAVGGGHLHHEFIGAPNRRIGFHKAFESEKDFNSAMIDAWRIRGGSNWKAEFYFAMFAELLAEHPPVFSHGDLQKKNVMIYTAPWSRSGPLTSVRQHPRIAIIDWEYAGWWPSYFDHVWMLHCDRDFDDDWCGRLHGIFSQDFIEYNIFKVFINDLRTRFSPNMYTRLNMRAWPSIFQR